MRYEIRYSTRFVRAYREVSSELKSEIKEAIRKLADSKNHKVLNVHKLHGRLKDYCACSVNFRYRIMFEYMEKDVMVLADVGDHNVYEQ